MTAADQIKPFELLRRLEQRGRACDLLLPEPDRAPAQWAGIAFRLGDRRLLAAMGAVVEVLRCPPIVPLARTQPWLRGLADVGGRLLPIIDLQGYLGEQPAASAARSCLLRIEHREVAAGLLIDELLGRRYFYPEQWRRSEAAPEAALAPYLAGEFYRDGESWPLFDVRALAEHPRFLQVAL